MNLTRNKRQISSEQKPWKLGKEEKEKMDEPLADFIIGQAEKAFAYTLDIADKTTNRTYGVIVLMVPLTSTVISLLVSELGKTGKARLPHRIELWSAGVIFCFIILALLLKIVLPRDTMGSGRTPKQLVDDSMLNFSHEKISRLLNYKFSEIKNLQHKIDFNERMNRIRIRRFKVALILICFAVLLTGILYAMTV